MIDIRLTDHKKFVWQRLQNVTIRGWYEKAGRIFDETAGFENIVCDTAEQLQQQLREMNGNYAVIMQKENKVFAAVDRICSFPLYYANGSDEKIYLSDNLDSLTAVVGKRIREQSREELLACGFVLGNHTIYEGIYQLQGGQMLTYNLETQQLQIQDYFLHKHCSVEDLSVQEWCDRLEKTVEHVIQRMIESIHGKTIALFLSGGYDSKLIAAQLKQLKYEKVICISLGGMDTKDVAVAKEIAEQLGFPWIRLDVSKKYWKNLRESKVLDDYFTVRARHGAMPYLQGFALKELIECGKVPRDCVAISGNSGDAIEGADVTHRYLPGKSYSAENVVDGIRFIHFILNGVKNSEKLASRLDLSFYSDKIYHGKTQFTDEEAEEVVEYFNWRERQCKYVINDVRNYDEVIGVEWRLPLWDNEFVDFWLSVPYQLRYDRALYYQYVRGEALPTANTVSFPRKCLNAAKKLFGRTVYFLYFPKVVYNYMFSTDFFWAPFGLMNWREFWKALWATKGYRSPHMTGVIHRLLKYL